MTKPGDFPPYFLLTRHLHTPTVVCTSHSIFKIAESLVVDKKLVINHEVWVCWLSFKSEFWLQFWHQKVEQVYADDMFIEIGAKIYQNLHLYKGDIGPPTPRFSGPAL